MDIQMCPLSTLEFFSTDLHTNAWSEAGILLVGHLLDKSNLLSYEDMSQLYGFPHKDFYKYL